MSYKTASPDRYPLLKAFARENRKNATQAETVLWKLLRDGSVGEKFLRQHVIGDYIVDFVSRHGGLIIEVDGGYHSEPRQKEEDLSREQDLEKMGYHVMRFSNEEVLFDTRKVIEQIENFLMDKRTNTQEQTSPLPHREGPGESRHVVIELQNVKRYFQVGSETVKALRGVSFKIYEGEFVTIQGTSGSGKSTLLNQLGCLDTPTSGEYYLDGIPVRTMSKTQRAHLRNRKIGFVFQNYNLLAKTTAIENVELPLMYNPDISASERRQKAINALKAVGLGDRLEHKSNQMSGGQMQRVAIARALVNDPAVLLADEATGNLDTRTSFEMLVLFQELYKQGHTIIFVTHNPEIAEYSSRNINLRDGKIREDTINTNIKSAAEALAQLPAPQDD